MDDILNFMININFDDSMKWSNKEKWKIPILILISKFMLS